MAEESMDTKPTDAKCVVCYGDIVERLVRARRPRDHRENVVGTASFDLARERAALPKVGGGYHCSQCGLMYQFLPPPEVHRSINKK